MERMISYLSLDRLYNYFGLAAGAMVSALGGWDVPLRALTAAMALDYASGVIAAAMQKKLSSAVGFSGLARKAMVFLIIIMAACLDSLTGQQNVCRTAVIAFYFVNESVSLMENAAKLGLPVPKKLLDALEQLRGEEGE